MMRSLILIGAIGAAAWLVLGTKKTAPLGKSDPRTRRTFGAFAPTPTETAPTIQEDPRPSPILGERELRVTSDDSRIISGITNLGPIGSVGPFRGV